jgi:hypothetical protein
MESNISDITSEQHFGADLPLAEPHFDEEATMLSARPVVPLEKVAARARRTRALVVALTFAGAVLVGMLAAGIYYSRFKGTTSSGPANTKTIPSGVEARATETNRPTTPAPAQPRVSVNSDTAAPVTVAPAPVEDSRTSTEAPKKPVARRVAVITFPRRSGGDSDGGDQERREARREEKDRRREMKRQNQENKSSRDLLRIREIFEGQRKP